MTELYADLDEKVLKIEADELRSRNEELQAKIFTLTQEHESEIGKLKNRVEILEKQKNNLEENISSLYETAVNELDRKDAMYSELQKEVNNLTKRLRDAKKDRI